MAPQPPEVIHSQAGKGSVWGRPAEQTAFWGELYLTKMKRERKNESSSKLLAPFKISPNPQAPWPLHREIVPRFLCSLTQEVLPKFLWASTHGTLFLWAKTAGEGSG